MITTPPEKMRWMRILKNSWTYSFPTPMTTSTGTGQLNFKTKNYSFRFIDWMMRLPDDLEQQWIEQVDQLETEKHMEYVTSVERFALKKGRVDIALICPTLTEFADQLPRTVGDVTTWEANASSSNPA